MSVNTCVTQVSLTHHSPCAGKQGQGTVPVEKQPEQGQGIVPVEKQPGQGPFHGGSCSTVLLAQDQIFVQLQGQQTKGWAGEGDEEHGEEKPSPSLPTPSLPSPAVSQIILI